MKQSLVLFLLTAVSLYADESWPNVQFVEVRAYAWPKEMQHCAVILEGMNLKPGFINKEGAVLTPEQTKRLLAAVNGKHPEHADYLCYIPHNAFVFYDISKKPVAFVEVCFGCLGSRISPVSSSKWRDLPAMAAIFEEIKLPLGDFPDLQSFKKHFQNSSQKSDTRDSQLDVHLPQALR